MVEWEVRAPCRMGAQVGVVSSVETCAPRKLLGQLRGGAWTILKFLLLPRPVLVVCHAGCLCSESGQLSPYSFSRPEAPRVGPTDVIIAISLLHKPSEAPPAPLISPVPRVLALLAHFSCCPHTVSAAIACLENSCSYDGPQLPCYFFGVSLALPNRPCGPLVHAA